MATADSGSVTRIRENMGLLVFISTTGILVLLWYLLLLAVGTEEFLSPIDWPSLILMWVIIPLIGGPVVSGIAILIAGLVQRTGCGFVIVLALGVAIPIAALIAVWIGSVIARALYIGPVEDEVAAQPNIAA